MASTEVLAGDQRQRLANQYETFVLSMATLRGGPLSADQMSQIVNRAIASASPEERRSPVPSIDAINRLQQFLVQVTDVGRPRNDFSAEAARAAQVAGGLGSSHGAGFGTIEALRTASSVRFRELSSSDAAKGGSDQNVGSPTGTGGALTAEFLRAYAGTGVSVGTVRTFSEVGLDRGTFNEFRKEGFSTAQITDNVRDVKALGWKGKDDLSIAQHASTDMRKAAVATEQAKTSEQKKKCREREDELERKNETRPESDPQKQHNRRFFERRHQDSLRHNLVTSLGSESQRHDTGLAVSRDRAQDGLMAKGIKKSVASLKSNDADDFGVTATVSPPSSKPTAVKLANAKPVALTPG